MKKIISNKNQRKSPEIQILKERYKSNKTPPNYILLRLRKETETETETERDEKKAIEKLQQTKQKIERVKKEHESQKQYNLFNLFENYFNTELEILNLKLTRRQINHLRAQKRALKKEIKNHISTKEVEEAEKLKALKTRKKEISKAKKTLKIEYLKESIGKILNALKESKRALKEAKEGIKIWKTEKEALEEIQTHHSILLELNSKLCLLNTTERDKELRKKAKSVPIENRLENIRRKKIMGLSNLEKKMFAFKSELQLIDKNFSQENLSVKELNRIKKTYEEMIEEALTERLNRIKENKIDIKKSEKELKELKQIKEIIHSLQIKTFEYRLKKLKKPSFEIELEERLGKLKNFLKQKELEERLKKLKSNNF